MDEQSLNQSNHTNVTTNGLSPNPTTPSEPNNNAHPQASFEIPPSISSHPALATINWSALSDPQRRDLAFRLHEHTKFVKLQQAAANLKSFNPEQQSMIVRALQSQHQKMLLLQQQQQLLAKRPPGSEEDSVMQKFGKSISTTNIGDQRERFVRPPVVQPSLASAPNAPRPQLLARPQQTVPTLSVTFADLQNSLSAVPPFIPEMSETEFLDSLSKFVGILRFSLGSLPLVRNKPIPLYRLFMMVYQVGGYESVRNCLPLTLFRSRKQIDGRA